MTYNDAIERLSHIINTCIDDEPIRLELLKHVNEERNIRGILYDLDKYKNRNLTDEEHDFCKDLFFYFG